MSVIKKRAVERRGRPRTFNVEEALDRTMHVFWEKGYEGASLDDLTEAMGISHPSLYDAFGDKAGLFKKALADAIGRVTKSDIWAGSGTAATGSHPHEHRCRSRHSS